MTASTLWLFIAFQVTHFLSDFPLQTKYMLRKFLPDNRFILPLAAHCGVHALFTFIICFAYFQFNSCYILKSLACALFDFCMHFIMDRVKADPELLGRYKPLTPEEYKKYDNIVNSPWVSADNALNTAKDKLKSNTLFWVSIGIDQTFHHLTHYAIIWKLVMG